MTPFKKLITVLRKPMSLLRFAGIMSLVNLVFYNIPFFVFIADNLNADVTSKVFFISCLTVAMLVINFMVCYLLIFLLRSVSKLLISICHILSATCVYFIMTYHTMMDATMLGNVFNTRYSEASGFMTWRLFLFILIFGLLPAIYVFLQKINYGSWKRLGLTVASSVIVTVALVLANLSQVLWIGKYDTELGGLVMPYSYLVNTVRLYDMKRTSDAEEIRLPDATIANDEKTAVVLVIGESARKANFQLYGYERPTNPRLSKQSGLTVLNANSNGTYTTEGTKAILEYKETDDLYEILPNYLFRHGVDVAWRTSNWGEPPVHIDEYLEIDDMTKLYPEVNRLYDGLLFTGVVQRIRSSQKNKVLIVLHTSTNHGPEYSSKYPRQFEVFKPVCTNVEQAKDSIPELINAYDNSIVYTDYLLSNLIDSLKQAEGWKCAMIYVSDHGESLGEKNLFMHGVPINIAPKEQYEIPFFIWTTPGFRKVKRCEETIDQHYVFHSVLDLLSVSSPIFDKSHSLFE